MKQRQRNRNRCLQAFALLLTVLLLFASLSLGAIAEGTLPTEEDGSLQTYSTESAESTESSPEAIDELRA